MIRAQSFFGNRQPAGEHAFAFDIALRAQQVDGHAVVRVQGVRIGLAQGLQVVRGHFPVQRLRLLVVAEYAFGDSQSIHAVEGLLVVIAERAPLQG